MEVRHKDFIGVYENAFSLKRCNEIIESYDNPSLIPRSSQYKSQFAQDNSITFSAEDPLTLEISDFLFTKIIPLYNKAYWIFENIGPYNNPEVKFQKTAPTQGYHAWHCENASFDNFFRIAAYTIYLNDIKEGGETEFLYQSLRVKPTQGTICIFPSIYTHLHRGNPPLLETKYILTGWINYVPSNQIN